MRDREGNSVAQIFWIHQLYSHIFTIYQPYFTNISAISFLYKAKYFWYFIHIFNISTPLVYKQLNNIFVHFSKFSVSEDRILLICVSQFCFGTPPWHPSFCFPPKKLNLSTWECWLQPLVSNKRKPTLTSFLEEWKPADMIVVIAWLN